MFPLSISSVFQMERIPKLLPMEIKFPSLLNEKLSISKIFFISPANSPVPNSYNYKLFGSKKNS